MTLLSLKNIFYTYQGSDFHALKGVSLDFESGKKVALIGRNGSGKSTLILIANGLIQADEGTIAYENQIVKNNKKSLRKLREHVGVVFQNPEEQLFSANVMQDISSGPLNLGLPETEARERVDEVVRLCDLASLLNRPTHALSGGEKARVALAGILAMRPDFLFVDEVTNSLDPWMRAQVFEILQAWVDTGKTVILSTHDWRFARQWADKIVWMENGQVYRQGPPSDVLTGPDLPKEYQNDD